ncbi:hypothetical protein RBEMOGI_1022 [Rickettsia bellii str. RML Mogi]|uniref:Uncharacterized protein n=2 Tax=Rickettsia bellii TaxID=33990 RepID=A0A0F3QIK9_RICBE|nr:hypothetical protein RBEAN4_1362 [Rickettsia bellii str. RML An4]KJV92393.1 hypothetical protein RBEMOGI_1022 [Rickettsia bellii str. RML Mogi]
MFIFLDTVVKPRYDIEGVFRSMQQCRHGMTNGGLSHALPSGNNYGFLKLAITGI